MNIPAASQNSHGKHAEKVFERFLTVRDGEKTSGKKLANHWYQGVRLVTVWFLPPP